jgi:hypothetical protein
LNSLTELKQAIDSMESRIENNVVDSFQQQLLLIGERYPAKTEVISVIQMMQAIGRYLGARRDTADKEALPVLKSLAVALEKFVTRPDLDKTQINPILSESIHAYKSLKAKIASQPLVTDAEIQDLKAVILAIDWEISNTTLQTFDAVTSRMMNRLKSHKILHAYLMIIHSIGRYIASKKATAHKDSLSFLGAVFENFERIVHQPDMPLKEKQQLIGTDIEAFQTFKREIVGLVENSPGSIGKSVPRDTSDAMEDDAMEDDTMPEESIRPALSHVKGSSRQVVEAVVPLDPSPERSGAGQSGEAENITPALAGRKKRASTSQDIMDDLFSGKESPADELLDAIHLANVQGPDQQQSININEPTKEELQREGIKNFTPHRRGNQPIPEIGDRLDEFFNLDTPSSHPAFADMESDMESDMDAFMETEPLADGSPMETIVPFQNEDESFEEIRGNENIDPEDSIQTILNRVFSLVKNRNGLSEEQIAIDQDLTYLKIRWQDDVEKTMLLDIISCLLMKTPPLPMAMDLEPMGDETAVPSPALLNDRPSGCLGKNKSIFFKSEKDYFFFCGLRGKK